MKRNVISFENVNITYANEFCAARDVSFAIEEGECLAIVGESGSGKTTLARAALGLLPATAKISGSIRVGETEIVGASNRTLRSLRGLVAGFVAQDPFAACNPLARVTTHVAEAWHVHALEPPENAVVDLLEKLGIENAPIRARKYPHEWSGGMLQRATIAAAAAHRPKLIIADEPTSALDASRADSILTILRSTGAAVLLVSHDINLVARHADRIAVCYDGQIVEINDAREVLERPQHPYTISLLNAVPRRDGEKSLAAAETTADVVLEAENLSRVYGHGADSVSAVLRANLQVRRGEIVGIYGNSGSGKSTLLRLLATIETPSSGTVSLGGEAVTSGENRRLLSKKMRNGFVMPIFQDPIGSLDRRWAIWRSATEPLMAAHRKKRPTRRERRQIAREIFAEVGLSEVNLDAKPFELSVGQCQRVSVARALVAEPKLLVADEPTSALDVSVSATILRLLARIAQKGTAIIIVSHDEPMLDSFCHRVLRMHKGVLSD